MLSTKYRAARKEHCRSAHKATPFSLAQSVLFAGGLAVALVACAPATVSSNGGSGGNQNGGSGGNQNGGSGGNSSGGAGSGGTSSGGAGSGGTSSGGAGSGGTTAKGGSGGTSAGGSGGNSGGSGGTSAGGAGSGGTSAGGAGSGGTSAGGSGGNSGGSGGTSAGGAGSGGTSAGGSGGTATGGTTSGGTGGSTGTGSRPPGYYYTADWNVTKADWHGCVWTGKDCSSNCPTGVTPVTGSDTSVTPSDFTSGTADGGPYRISGTVYNDYNAVALLGFNINEAIDSAKGATQCKYDPALKDGPPTGTVPSGATGIAVNWSATTLPVTFRIQIQGVKGATDPNNRWCATIKDTKGPSFIPFTDFNTQCWPGATAPVAYKNEPIDAVSFLVPGTTTAKSPYDITVVGFAPGTSAADAPGPAAACGTRTGSVGQTALQGDATKDTDASTQRAVTDGKDCKKYIVNNNNWGSPSSSYQKLSFTGNSFTVDAMNGTGSSAPASFPSLYVGGNGQTLNGTFVTWDDTFPSKQPTAISAIGSANSTFKWSGKSSGDFNTSYDIWFSKSIPTAGSYNDAISGFIMVWLYKPSSRQPIGSVVRQANIGGVDYDVWAGPRGNTSTGTDPAGRPVISYVAKSTVTSFSADLKAFFTDAVNAADNQNGITQTFSSSWYLTDVFAGFEIWSGGAGLKADEVTISIK